MNRTSQRQVHQCWNQGDPADYGPSCPLSDHCKHWWGSVHNHGWQNNRLQHSGQGGVIVIRWVNEHLKPHEDFIGFYAIPVANSDTLVEVIANALIRMNLSLANCTGQCYDGAAVMKGLRNGVSTQATQGTLQTLLRTFPNPHVSEMCGWVQAFKGHIPRRARILHSA